MNPEIFLATENEGKMIGRGRVVGLTPEGTVLVALDDELALLACDLLHTSETPLKLQPEDRVLLWHSGEDQDRGVILGRIGGSARPAPAEDKIPDELVLEAKQQLVLKCGEGSLVLRGDGKILLKGKELVSRAEKVIRLKGAAIAIN